MREATGELGLQHQTHHPTTTTTTTSDPAVSMVNRYSAVTEPGDLLYVPTWWWHRVDYLPDETSLTGEYQRWLCCARVESGWWHRVD